MQAPRVAARVESWNIGENEETAEPVVGNGDDDEFEEPEELRRVTVGRAPTERDSDDSMRKRTIRCTESVLAEETN